MSLYYEQRSIFQNSYFRIDASCDRKYLSLCSSYSTRLTALSDRNMVLRLQHFVTNEEHIEDI